MTILHNECVLGCDGQPFPFGTKRVASCDDLPAAVDGSETKVVAGANATVTGTGTTADPYVVAASGPGAASDGSETKVVAGANTTVTGTGTTADPYVVAASPPGVTADGSETKVTAGAHTTVTGTGTTADPYVVAEPAVPSGTAVAAYGSPAPAANASRYYRNTSTGELWFHDGTTWSVVASLASGTRNDASGAVPILNGNQLVMPRAGFISVSALMVGTYSGPVASGGAARVAIAIDGVEQVISRDNGQTATDVVQASCHYVRLPVAAGSILSGNYTATGGAFALSATNLAYTYID